jgi:hypothetical protein
MESPEPRDGIAIRDCKIVTPEAGCKAFTARRLPAA